MKAKQNTVTRNIGMNRGKPRIWLEGAILQDNGFEHGKRWNVEHDYSAQTITISEASDGKRKIAGKAGRPIIDMSASSVTKAIDTTNHSQVIVVSPKSGQIVITAI